MKILKQVICEKCKNEFEYVQTKQHSERRFCSQKCANSHIQTKKQNEARRKKAKNYFATISPELKSKISTLISEKNKKRLDRCHEVYNKNCLFCNEPFSTKNRKKRFCSLSCAAKYNLNTGRNLGWSTRKFKSSYAESFFEKVLINNEIKFIREKKVGLYFIDFALKNKIALEIDGKQHKKPDRKSHDDRRDEFLKQQGWFVYRIQWKSVNRKSGSEYIKKEIENFLNFFKNYNPDVAQSG